MIVIDLSKQQAFDADPKEMQQINFTGNLNQQVTMCFINEETRNYFRLFTRNHESIKNFICFNIIPI